MSDKLNSREQRIIRTGEAIFQMAKGYGWKETDAEGAIEFILRYTYETGWDDHKRAVEGTR